MKILNLLKEKLEIIKYFENEISILKKIATAKVEEFGFKELDQTKTYYVKTDDGETFTRIYELARRNTQWTLPTIITGTEDIHELDRRLPDKEETHPSP